jgi:HNH endonuclease
MHPYDIPCKEWDGPRNPNGYGTLSVNGTRWFAHRWAWVQRYGSIPAGMQVLHRCDNPPCCEPLHLFLGTQSDNIRDMYSKGRGLTGAAHPMNTRMALRAHSLANLQRGRLLVRGERHHQAILTEAQVLAIRADYQPFVVTQRMLAAKYGVSVATIKAILNGRIWAHLLPSTSQGVDRGL